jgi:hypothetical protein
MGQRTRVLTAEFVLRAVIVMMLLPQASYTEVMTVLAGDLVLVPWAQDWRVPSPRVLSAWRTSTGPGPLEYLRDKVLTAALTEHGEHDWRAVRVGDLHLRSADGTLTRVPDTPANRRRGQGPGHRPGPRHRVLGDRRRPGRPRDVLPDHRPAGLRGVPGEGARRRLPVAVGRVGNRAARNQEPPRRRRPLHRADAPLQVPAAGPAGTRRLGTGRRTGPRPGPRRRPRRSAAARTGRRAGHPVHPRQLSFTAARRAAITSIRQGTAAAGLPAATVAAGTARLLAAVGRARHVTDRNRHRPRNTKPRQAFEKAHRNTPTWIAEAVLDICGQAA